MQLRRIVSGALFSMRAGKKGGHPVYRLSQEAHKREDLPTSFFDDLVPVATGPIAPLSNALVPKTESNWSIGPKHISAYILTSDTLSELMYSIGSHIGPKLFLKVDFDFMTFGTHGPIAINYRRIIMLHNK